MSHEVLEGITCHLGPPSEDDSIITEYFVVKLAERISFCLSDFEDLISLGYLVHKPSCAEIIGKNLQE